MDLFEAIKTRRSVRSFTSKDVTDDQVVKIIEAATWAPSAGNLQPWEFIVVRNEETKRKLARAALNQDWLVEAPVVIVACANEKRSSWYGERGRTLYCICDTSAAIQNLLLAVHALGLGACWIGAFHEDEVSSILRIPRGVRPIAIIPIGYPAEHPRPPERRPVKDVIHSERYG
ncbi:MAG: nitroreductase family protein [Candidatus Nezhaarchaeales archaeon]